MIISCDPGMSGGFAFIEESQKTLSISSVEFVPFPTIGKEINFSGIHEIFNKMCTHIDDEPLGVIEKVSAMPGQGVSSMFKFGRAYGIAQSIFSCAGIMLNEVTPQSWQKEMFQGMPEIKKPTGKRDTKKMSLYAASKLFPTLQVDKDWKSDALLIGEYIRRKQIARIMMSTQDLTAALHLHKNSDIIQ